MTDLAAIPILIPARLHAHAVERIGSTFDRIAIERGDPALLAPERMGAMRGIASMTRVDAALIDALPALEIIANFGVGYDGVDFAHASAKGIMVTNTPDVLTDEVADTAIGLLLNTLRELPKAEAWLRDGRWARDGHYPLTKTTLRGRTAGIFGMGRIGQAIARRLEGFGIPVSYHNRSPVEGVGYTYHATLKGLAESVDTLISVAPGTPATEKAVNAEILKALGPDGVFVNLGRGSTVDQPALIEALRDGTIRAAGLDVFADEPNVPAELVALQNASLLPHVGSASEHTRRAMADLVVDNLVAWFSGKPAITPVPETAKLNRRSV